MPPTFLYGLAFGLWLCLACVVWLASFCLLVAPVTRSMGKRLALAMVATFPGVFAFQLLASPIIVCTVAATVFAATIIDPSRSSDTTNPTMIAVTAAGLLLALSIAAGASLLGFWEGWRVGWICAQGRSWREVIGQGPTGRAVKMFRRRR